MNAIKNSETDVYNIAQDGGGISIFTSNVRGKNQDVKNMKNSSNGIIAMLKMFESTVDFVD